jgi:hypothetical protein
MRPSPTGARQRTTLPRSWPRSSNVPFIVATVLHGIWDGFRLYCRWRSQLNVSQEFRSLIRHIAVESAGRERQRSTEYY